MEQRSASVAGGAVAEPVNDVRVANAVERHSFVLEVLDEGAFKVGVEIVLEKYVKGFYRNKAVRRFG